jgi:HD-GYP domain-containing protein (c-di-GMP phosphodiesterase class II)
MTAPRIVMAGLGRRLEGLTWEADSVLRIGSHDGMDIVLNDASVSRRHAEIRNTGGQWIIRDVGGSQRLHTLLNGMRLGRGDYGLKPEDVIHCGNLALRVAALEGLAPAERTVVSPAHPPEHIQASGTFVRVEAAAQDSWDQALQRVSVAGANQPEPAETMLTLLRTGQHLSQIAGLDELLRSVLADVTAALGARRGSIVLANPRTGELELRASQGNGGQKCYSRTLAERVFRSGESLLCRDVRADEALSAARSVKLGAMASMICLLLRSPRQRLGVLQLDRDPLQEPFQQSDLHLADAIAASVAVGIESAQLVEQQREQFIQTVTSMARAVDIRDQYTGDHIRRVTDYALLLAEELKLPAVQKYEIQIGTPLHDIGKIGIADAILCKPGKLTPAEFDAMKQHTVKGAAILESICNLSPIIPIVRNHHERWDGSGYPDGLSRDHIAVTARIVAVADAFDAMTSNRPYRTAMPSDLAFLELLRKSGSHFDPACVSAFLRLRPRIEARM